jgi:hypothetical protein
MGASYFAQRGMWWNGTSSLAADQVQDDLAVIAGAANGFGYRPDDHGQSRFNSTPLGASGTTFSGPGVIERTNDLDMFSFTVPARSAVTFNVSGAPRGPMLDAILNLYAADGSLMRHADTAALGETVSVELPAGTYWVAVGSHGGYGDVGQYTVNGTYTPLLVPGDANGDGTVGPADFDLLFAHFGTTGTWADGDFDRDGVIGFSDFQILELNWGTTSSPAPASASAAVSSTEISRPVFSATRVVVTRDHAPAPVARTPRPARRR